MFLFNKVKSWIWWLAFKRLVSSEKTWFFKLLIFTFNSLFLFKLSCKLFERFRLENLKRSKAWRIVLKSKERSFKNWLVILRNPFSKEYFEFNSWRKLIVLAEFLSIICDISSIDVGDIVVNMIGYKFNLFLLMKRNYLYFYRIINKFYFILFIKIR